MTTAPRRTGRSSDRPRLTRTSAEDFALSGPSNPPDPNFNAYRQDLADVALIGRVIASHYAEPVNRLIARATPLRSVPSEQADTVDDLAEGDAFALLDDSLGWAWGYAGPDKRVGYVPSVAVGPA